MILPFLVPVVALIAAFVLTSALIPLVIRLAFRLRLLDEPDDDRRVHTVAVPRLGGTAIMVATSTVVLGGSIWSHGLDVLPELRGGVWVGITLGAAIIFGIGLLDDVVGVSPLLKLIAQTLAAAVVIAFGFRVGSLALAPGTPALTLGLATLPITMLWVVGMTNAFNLIDGVDGLAGTIAVIALVTVIGVDLLVHSGTHLLAPVALVGGVLGFLRFNRSPARIFLGDSGSMTIGFFLAVQLPLSASQADGSTYLLIPLFALAYPLLDTFVAMTRRWLRGDPISQADGRHIHHQLLAVGLRTDHAVHLLGTVFLVVALLGMSITFAPPQLTLALLLASVVLLVGGAFYGTGWLRYTEFRELGSSLTSVIRNARAVIREKVLANEVAERIRQARHIDEVRQALSSLLDDVRLLDIELIPGDVRLHGPERQRISPIDRIPVRFDYPFALSENRETLEIILRLWSPRPANGDHPAIERVANRVGPALEEWFRRHPSMALTVVPGSGPHRVKEEPEVLRDDRT